MRVVREARSDEYDFETIHGRLKTGKKYSIKLEENELLIYLDKENFELSKEEMIELERVCSILEGI